MKRPALYGLSAVSVVAGSAALALVFGPGVTGSHSRPRPAPAAAVTPASAVGDTQRGFAMPTYSQDGYQTRQATSYLHEIKAVGARWVQINPTWYQNGPHASAIAASWQTPSDTSVDQVISEAHQAGLKVLLKPLLDLVSDGGGYRGTIRPTNRAAWFASYVGFIGHYASLAERLHVEQFAVGTELAAVSADRSGWLRVVTAVRARYRGQLLYAANFDEYRHVAFWDVLDVVGIDAYWKLSAGPTADVAALQEAWTPLVRELAAFAARTRRRILFTEAGYTSQRASTTAPWSWSTGRTPDQTEQAAAYQALLVSLDHQPWWAGVFWWSWDVPLAPVPNDPLGYSPHGKAAEAVVRRWWT